MTTKNKELIMMFKFTLFSISAGIVQVLSFTLLNEVVKMRYWPAYLISLTLSVIWNFTINRKFTFKSANNVPVAMMKVFGFYLVFTPLSTLWGHLLTGAGWNEYLVLVGTMLINFVAEFLYQRYFVFRTTIDSAK